MSSIGNWVMALVTLGLYSILIKDNRFFRIVEHLYVGVTAGNAIVVGWVYIRNSGLEPLSKGNLLVIVPLLLGLLQFTRFSKNHSWVSRYPVQWLVGVGIGVSLVSTLNVQFIGQATATMRPLTSVNAAIIFVGTLTTVAYFRFSGNQTHAVKTVGQVGRFIMMVAFGASFGNVVMGRIALVVNRFQDIFGTWLGLI